MKILLHSCCAPCLTGCMITLGQEKPDLFWYNPNIHPYTEYCSRRDSLITLAKEEKLELIMEDEYGLRDFLRANTNTMPPERCEYCYRLRLKKTAQRAAENGYGAFSTTLLISPHQNHDLIHQIGEEYAHEYGIEFFYKDFRPWFREGQKKARERNSYMQKYCGCIFSEEERYIKNVQ